MKSDKLLKSTTLCARVGEQLRGAGNFLTQALNELENSAFNATIRSKIDIMGKSEKAAQITPIGPKNG